LALRTQFRSRLRQRAASANALATGLDVANTLDDARGSESRVEVTFDTTQTPPSYGDFFNVVMVARFLAASGIKTSFRIRDYGARRADWNLLTPEDQETHLTECLALAHNLLAGCDSVKRSSRPFSSKVEQAISPLEGHSIPAYQLSQTIFQVLMQHCGWTLPDGFLLSLRDVSAPAAKPANPYISWHIRRGTWEKARDTTSSDLQRDFLQLRAAFPDHEIMLFSSRTGIDFALEQLKATGHELDCLLAQPEPGFLSAAPYVYASHFYFQRRGGGLSQYAIYSRHPYLILNDHASYYYLRDGDRLVPWATPNQRYVVKRGVERLSLSHAAYSSQQHSFGK